MAPKAKIPAPIDRPLSRAYLREFSGWSTAYPPGLSDPTSLRIMENMLVNRDGSLRVRPGMRYLSYKDLPGNDTPGNGILEDVVGTHEVFFLNNGSKAYLFAVRESDSTVGFRVLVFSGTAGQVRTLTDPLVGFTVQGNIKFTAATTYVKYLQIDNKIFALSDAGEPMRYFTVGSTKTAKKLSSIDVPDWRVEDKLTVFHPDAPWINGGIPTSVRTNLMPPPSFEASDFYGWRISTSAYPKTWMTLDTTLKRSGAQSIRLESLPTRTNLCPEPLHNLAVTGLPANWISSTNGGALTVTGGKLRMAIPSGSPGRTVRLQSPKIYPIDKQHGFRFAFDLDSISAGDMKLLVRYYSAAGAAIGEETVEVGNSIGRHNVDFFDAPANVVYFRCWPTLIKDTSAVGVMTISNVCVTTGIETGSMFTGDSGTNYYWTGTVNNSASVYHPPTDVALVSPDVTITAAAVYRASGYIRGTHARSVEWGHQQLDVDGAITYQALNSGVAADTAAWARFNQSITAATGSTKLNTLLIGRALGRNEYLYLDDVLVEKSGSLGAYFDGDTASTPTVTYAWTGTPRNSTSTESVYSLAPGFPTAETPAVDTLVSTNTTGHTNDYNFGLFYSFENEVGESAASMVRTLRTMRAWGQWKMELPNAAGEPGGTPTAYPERSADQLVAVLPQAVFDQAVAEGALSWSLYLLTWSNQDNVPTEAVKISEIDLRTDKTYANKGWARVTAQAANAGGDVAVIPTINNRYNYSNPSTGGNGLVAADRMILVKDPAAAAVIRWTSNKQGEYTNFSAIQGGGYKTLTSGNLFIPACVKLWQNPQSADTLTILCQGVDGMSTGYYMAPATVTSQSDTTQIMAFEETTATPGTTSPYGCEVFNNALYHPLEDQLMKSTASNYNINHKSLTDQIEFDWQDLHTKEWIISSQHENRLYFIVNNPKGAPLETGCKGNEIWVYDAASDTGTWSRFLIQACSLRKMEQGGRIYMSVIRPDGIFYLDPEYDQDDFVYTTFGNGIGAVDISWKFETNVQGANRAHDAWAMLQQMELVLGNYQGSIEWGLRSWDINGKPVRITKILRDLEPPSDDGLPWDRGDKLLVRKGLQEWYFFANSVTGEKGVGQVNSVQYRYAPLSVNDGYERGSVETFEYGRETANYGSTRTDAGVPQPFTDTRRP